MAVSRQDGSRSKGRVNQRTRTRLALMQAAGELIRDGRAPSMPEAAERALVSVATAYRYFRSAEELWEEAAVFDTRHFGDDEEVEAAIEAHGDDVEARLTTLIRLWGWTLLDNHVAMRRAAKASLDRWFALQRNDRDEDPRRPLRPRQRNRWNAIAVAPLRKQYEDHQVDSLIEALGFVWGAEPGITALDVLGLSVEAAKERQLTTALWVLRGCLADFDR